MKYHFSGNLNRLNEFLQKHRMLLLFLLIILTAIFRNIRFEINYALFLGWGIYFVTPIWLYTRSNTSNPSLRLLAYVIGVVFILLAMTGAVLISLSYFKVYQGDLDTLFSGLLTKGNAWISQMR